MIPRSPVIAGLSVVVALAAHAALLVEADEGRVEIAGGGSTAPAALGNSFADLAQGRASAVEAETTAEATEPAEALQPVDAAEAQSAAQPTDATAAPAVSASIPPVRPDASAANGLTPITETVPVVDAAVTPAATATSQASVAPVPQAVAPVTNARVAPVASPSELAPDKSLRPAVRPVRQVKWQPVAKPAPAAPRGNSTRNAQAGSSSGAEGQTAPQANSARAAQDAGEGNAAASNYPGAVMRQITRLPKPRSSARGVAHVAFVIGAGGQVTSVRIARSSGSPALDQLAVRQIRRAAPFPPPPAGARRQFTIGIKGS